MDQPSSSNGTTYADAGVNIDAGNALIDMIKPLVKATSRPGTSGDLGGFGGLFDLKATHFDDPILVAATDGVGTKLKIAFAMDSHKTIGIDLVAMCVNDLIVQGAEPLFFLDYFATGGLNTDVATDVIAGIAEGCRQSNCALIGGETAEMPGMYKSGHYDLAGFAVGAVERHAMLPRLDDLAEGDVIIGLASSGIHSNGYSLVRHILAQKGGSFSDATPFDSPFDTIGDALLSPTKIYVTSCLKAIEQGGVKALAHITGGGLTENIPRILPDHLAASITVSNWECPAIFQWLSDAGSVAEEEMLRTFNCGIGMIIVVSADSADSLCDVLSSAGEIPSIIGSLTKRTSADSAVTYS